MTQAPAGGPAQTTYCVTDRNLVTGRAAQRVFVVTDGRPIEGGPQQAVYYVSDAEIASGEFVISSNKPIPIAEVGAEGATYPPIAVYVVTAASESDFPPTVEPVAPLFDSAEIGLVNASTLDVTFDQGVNASDYSGGVTIKVNGTATSITSATQQANHAIVRYVIPVLWHGSGDVVTWEYDSGSGNIVSESDSTPLNNVTAQTATNNCEYFTIYDLQADTLALADNSPISSWSDQTPNGTKEFTQTGAARPIKTTIDSYDAVSFADGGNSFLVGQNWEDTDNQSQFAVMTIHQFVPGEGIFYYNLATKFDNDAGTGWSVQADYYMELWNGWTDYTQIIQNDINPPFIYGAKHVVTVSKIDNATMTLYVDSDACGLLSNNGTVSSFSNSQLMFVGTMASDVNYRGIKLYTEMMFNPIPNSTNRAALEARLAARYGVTL